MFNPKVRDFLEENKNITVIGLYWSGYWRLMVCIIGVSVVIGFIAGLIE